MIQRIQSVYLVLIAMLSAITVVLPVADLINSASNLNYLIDIRGISLIKPTGEAVLQSTTWTMTSFALVIGVLAIIALFSFKKRVKQIRLCVMNFIFMIGYYILMLIFIWMACSQLGADWHLRFTVVLPLISMILNYLAIGAIGKDEKLVKSLDRLR
jgi:hypothetical protein